MTTEKLTVEGMSCGHCVNTIESALKESGVNAKVDLQSKSVDVEFDESQIDIGKIKGIIREKGYSVQ
jgi:copper chaperone